MHKVDGTLEPIREQLTMKSTSGATSDSKARPAIGAWAPRRSRSEEVADLQMTFGVFGQDRPRYTLQGDVHALREVLEALRQVGQPGTWG